jgi:plastocyanin
MVPGSVGCVPVSSPPRSRRLAAVAAAAAVLTLSACNSQGRPANTGTGTASVVDGVPTVTILTGPDRVFRPNMITVHPGPVRLVLKNRVHNSGGPPHDLKFADFAAGFIPLVYAGRQRSVTFTAPALGRYQFVCTIHAGQTGVMVVTR